MTCEQAYLDEQAREKKNEEIRRLRFERETLKNRISDEQEFNRQSANEISRLRAERDDYREALDRATRQTIQKVTHATVEGAALATTETASRCVELCEKIDIVAIGQSPGEFSARDETRTDIIDAITAEFGLEGK